MLNIFHHMKLNIVFFMVVLITDNKPFGGGNSCQYRPRDSWWVIRVFFLEGWHNQIHHLMRITLALSWTDLSLLAPKLARWHSPETVMPGTLWLFPHPWWLSMKYYSHFHSQKVLVKNSPLSLFLKLSLFVSKVKLVHLHQLSSKVSIHRSALSRSFTDSPYAST